MDLWLWLSVVLGWDGMEWDEMEGARGDVRPCGGRIGWRIKEGHKSQERHGEIDTYGMAPTVSYLDPSIAWPLERFTFWQCVIDSAFPAETHPATPPLPAHRCGPSLPPIGETRSRSHRSQSSYPAQQVPA